jgi:pyroglutamyl-peptidase
VREAGIAASVSQTAGTFVCNQVFYRLQHALAGSEVRSGFIHVPGLPDSGQPSMALPTLVEGLRLAVAAAWQTQVDIVEAGGRVS